MLHALKQAGRFVAVASSKPEAYVLRILEHFDLLQYFDEVVGASMDEKLSAKKISSMKPCAGWAGLQVIAIF